MGEDGFKRQVGTRALGALVLHLAVAADVFRLDFRLLHEEIQQALEAGYLSAGGEGFLEVADQADAYGFTVELFAADMATLELPLPAVADLDVTISGAVTVTDHEMIGQAVFHLSGVAVILVKTAGVTDVSGAMVDHDVLPAVGEPRRPP